MEIHNFRQGTPEWHEFRATHFGASEAAAMLGLSKQIIRNELLLKKKTGKSKEYSDWVQKNILDHGHDVENKARELIQSEIGDDLFPVTCSDGVLSASCDGLSMDESIAFEHKQYNKELFESVQNGEPGIHMAQCQQILLVTGAKKLIFVCSDGTKEKWAQIDIYPDESWFKKIRSGWQQFKVDLESFEPKPVELKPEAHEIKQLPSLNVQISGQVVASNLTEFKIAANNFIESINTKLISDDDFVNAESNVKFCDEIEKKLEVTKSAVMGQAASIDEVMREIDFIKESVRSKRLTLEKLVKTQKENIKTKIIDDAYKLCAEYLHSLDPKHPNIHLGSIVNLSRQSFETACKNKRTLSSLQNAVDTEASSLKIKINDIARAMQANLLHLPSDLSLFRDLQSIITKPEEDFKLIVKSRLEEQKRKEEEAAKRAVEEAKAAEERAKAMQVAADERSKLNVAIKPSEEDLTKSTNDKKDSGALRPKTEEMIVMDEVVAKFVALGLNQALAERLFLEIKSGRVNHVAII